MTMTLEQVRDWFLARINDAPMQRSVSTSDYQLRQMADAIDAHLTQPAQSMDVEKVRGVIAEMRGQEVRVAGYETWSDKLTAALQGKGE